MICWCTQARISPLYVAAQYNRVATLKALLQLKANVSAANEDVCFRRSLRPFRVYALDEQGYTPFKIAAQKGYIEALSLLAEAKANVNHVDGEGMTALHQCAGLHQTESVRALISLNAFLDLEERNVSPMRPVQFCA